MSSDESILDSLQKISDKGQFQQSSDLTLSVLAQQISSFIRSNQQEMSFIKEKVAVMERRFEIYLPKLQDNDAILRRLVALDEYLNATSTTADAKII